MIDTGDVNPVSATEDAARAVGLPRGYRLAALETVDSTNAVARHLSEQAASDRVVVWAKTQMAGRGRAGRVWQSPPGNLYLSAVLMPPVPLSRAYEISFLASVALVDCLRSLLPDAAEVGVKWPNDVLIGRGKVAGILVETEGDGAGGLAHAILGVGLNLASAPEIGQYRTTSVLAHGLDISPADVLPLLVQDLENWRTRWETEGRAVVLNAWRRHLYGIGQPVRVVVGGEAIEGLLEGVDGFGAARIREPSGRPRRITAGDMLIASNQDPAAAFASSDPPTSR